LNFYLVSLFRVRALSVVMSWMFVLAATPACIYDTQDYFYCTTWKHLRDPYFKLSRQLVENDCPPDQSSYPGCTMMRAIAAYREGKTELGNALLADAMAEKQPWPSVCAESR